MRRLGIREKISALLEFLPPYEAIRVSQKLAAVEALEHFTRQSPPMEGEEQMGWNLAISRINRIAQDSQDPEEAAEYIRNIIDLSPAPKNGRDRGRLRCLNEALDTLTKGGGDQGVPQGQEMGKPPGADVEENLGRPGDERNMLPGPSGIGDANENSVAPYMGGPGFIGRASLGFWKEGAHTGNEELDEMIEMFKRETVPVRLDDQLTHVPVTDLEDMNISADNCGEVAWAFKEYINEDAIDIDARNADDYAHTWTEVNTPDGWFMVDWTASQFAGTPREQVGFPYVQKIPGPTQTDNEMDPYNDLDEWDKEGFFQKKADARSGMGGAIVALVPDEGFKQSIVVPGGLPPEDLHVTLVPVGPRNDVEQDTFWGVVGEWAQSVGPLQGTAVGYGQFNTSKGWALYMAMDVPGGEELREDLLATLEAVGIVPRNAFPFTPHITLDYADEPFPVEEYNAQFQPGESTLFEIVVTYGSENRQVVGGKLAMDHYEQDNVWGQPPQPDEPYRIPAAGDDVINFYDRPEYMPANYNPPDPNPWAPDLSHYMYAGSLGGSTGAQLVQDNVGDNYVMKRGSDPGHLMEESYADDVYRAVGIAVPASNVYTDENGDPAKVSMFHEGTSLQELIQYGDPSVDSVVMQLREGFAVDALIGNWDVIGLDFDNIIVDERGTALRIDNGGSLRRRAQGGIKPSGTWSCEVGEIYTMRDRGMNYSSGTIFGDLSDQEIATQIRAYILPNREKILSVLPPDLVEDMNCRIDYMAQWAGVDPYQVMGKLAAERETIYIILPNGEVHTDSGTHEEDVYEGDTLWFRKGQIKTHTDMLDNINTSDAKWDELIRGWIKGGNYGFIPLEEEFVEDFIGPTEPQKEAMKAIVSENPDADVVSAFPSMGQIVGTVPEFLKWLDGELEGDKTAGAVEGLPGRYNSATGEREPWIFDDPVPGAMNKFLVDNEGNRYFWEVGEDLEPQHMKAQKMLKKNLGIEGFQGNGVVDMRGETPDVQTLDAGPPIDEDFDVLNVAFPGEEFWVDGKEVVRAAMEKDINADYDEYEPMVEFAPLYEPDPLMYFADDMNYFNVDSQKVKEPFPGDVILKYVGPGPGRPGKWLVWIKGGDPEENFLHKIDHHGPMSVLEAEEAARQEALKRGTRVFSQGPADMSMKEIAVTAARIEPREKPESGPYLDEEGRLGYQNAPEFCPFTSGFWITPEGELFHWFSGNMETPYGLISIHHGHAAYAITYPQQKIDDLGDDVFSDFFENNAENIRRDLLEEGWAVGEIYHGCQELMAASLEYFNPEQAEVLTHIISSLPKDNLDVQLEENEESTILSPDAALDYLQGGGEVLAAIERNHLPPINPRGMFDLKKYVELEGTEINWEEFINTSSSPDEELTSMLETFTDIGVLRSLDENAYGGRFEVDKQALENALSPDRDEVKGKGREESSEGLREEPRRSEGKLGAFQVGDRVRTEDFTGTVTDVDEDDFEGYPYLVEWDDGEVEWEAEENLEPGPDEIQEPEEEREEEVLREALSPEDLQQDWKYMIVNGQHYFFPFNLDHETIQQRYFPYDELATEEAGAYYSPSNGGPTIYMKNDLLGGDFDIEEQDQEEIDQIVEMHAYPFNINVAHDGADEKFVRNSWGEWIHQSSTTEAKLAQADDDDHSEDGMICLVPPEELRELLAIEGGEDPDDMHVTLVYLPDVQSIDKGHLLRICEDIFMEYGEMVGCIAGLGTFVNKESQDVLYASVDMPSLDDLRSQLATELENEGIVEDADSHHGFTAHLTLDYTDGHYNTLPKMPEGYDEDTIWEPYVVYGEEWIPLAGVLV